MLGTLVASSEPGISMPLDALLVRAMLAEFSEVLSLRF